MTHARKRFGQHFLEAGWAERVVAAIAPSPLDTLIEIGPGRGALTFALARRARRVIAIEIDRDLAPRLAERTPPNVEIVNADVLDTDLSGYVSDGEVVRVVGNLPYNVATPILFKLLVEADEGRRIRDATVMVQLEVADRLAAEPGSKAWGVLSICQQLRAHIERLLVLPPNAFRPAPKVHSAIVRLAYRPSAAALLPGAPIEAMARSLFTKRRKVLSNALAPFAGDRGIDPDDILARAGLDPRRRPETLDLVELARLAGLFVSAGSASA
ncbi:MAG TPA: 16S rRNA (adenine(1518)-N(6)/adenine(1519)-N(6))-dimethyltransferase RsmA [Vicinamibacterales bacterium]|jgi:16S rRNA (adenine1518-N6/adenine1519-N6)-dimethyltransferase